MDLWLILFPWIFMSSYTTIYFFVNNFFPMFIYQWIQYSDVLICFWLRNMPSIKYVRNWRNGCGSSKMCTGVHSGRGVKKLVIRYVRITWMIPNKCLGIFFVHWLAKYTRASSKPPRRMSLFSSIIITMISWLEV